MEVQQPALGRRLLFWTFGLRLPPPDRPWVAAQLTDPRFSRRKMRGVLVLQLVLVIVPQTAIAVNTGGGRRLLIPVFLVAVCAVAVLFWRPLTARQLRQALAYHGVRPDGSLCEPLSLLGSNPLGRTGLLLLTAQMLVFSSGIAVAIDQHSAQRRCQQVPAASLSALASRLGVPGLGGFGPVPAVPVGSSLVGARRVKTALAGVSYVGAYVRTPDGLLVGPGVWRMIEPGGVLPTTTLHVSAYDQLARRITPSTGYGSTTPEDPAVATARRCAQDPR